MANGNGNPQPDNITVMPDPSSATQPILKTTPSIIAIPPQFATTLVWIGLGFVIGVIVMNRKDKRGGGIFG